MYLAGVSVLSYSTAFYNKAMNPCIIRPPTLDLLVLRPATGAFSRSQGDGEIKKYNGGGVF